MRLTRLARRGLALPSADRRRVLSAAALLGCANLALKLLPFQRAISFGSVPIAARSGDPSRAVRDSVRAVERASYVAPWRSVCIHEGLVLQRMLRRQGLPALLCYGTSQKDGQLRSHVWVMVEDEIVLGAEEAPNYQLVATYPRSAETPASRPSSSFST